jgi:hypothetical protein
VWPVVVVEVLEAVDEWIDLVDLRRKIERGVELISPCSVAAFDACVELGAFGRQFVEENPLVLACLFELGLELGASIDLDCLLSRKRLAAWAVALRKAWPTVHLATGS